MKATKPIIRDFHLHTIYSDGLFKPAKLIDEAARLNVRQVAITDHNTVAGLPEAAEVSKQRNLIFTTGIEITSRLHGKEIHILGYAFHLKALAKSPLTEYISHIKIADDHWAQQVARLSLEQPIILKREDGTLCPISIHPKELTRFKDSTKSSYFHFGVLLQEKLASYNEELAAIPARHLYYFLFRRKEPEYLQQYASLFAKYGIKNQRYWYIPRKKVTILSADEVIVRLLDIGAVPVIAHPGEMQLTHVDLQYLRDRGLKGVEVFTPKHTPKETRHYEEIASSLKLFCTSGTDYHDPHHRNRVMIGRNRQGKPFTQGVTVKELRTG
jgi:predicted metal-dependent phosphoesterase TrpH